MKHGKSSFFHHLLQITDESSQVYFDVVEHAELLRAVLASSLFANLEEKDIEIVMKLFHIRKNVCRFETICKLRYRNMY